VLIKMPLYDVPTERACFGLLEKYQTPHHIVLHSQKVCDVAKVVAESLVLKDIALDVSLVRASSLLHDIGKYPCIVDGKGYHDARGEQILQHEGFPAVARIVGQHVILKVDPANGLHEEHVVYYADKRVVHDQLVSLDERFVYLQDTYGKTTEAVKRLMAMKMETIRLEQTIFQHLDFHPEDVIGLLE
jgi:hypothetical protein